MTEAEIEALIERCEIGDTHFYRDLAEALRSLLSRAQTAERQRDEAREAAKIALASLVAAHSLLKRGGKKAAPSDKMFEQMLKDYENAITRTRSALTGEN